MTESLGGMEYYLSLNTRAFDAQIERARAKMQALQAEMLATNGAANKTAANIGRTISGIGTSVAQLGNQISGIGKAMSIGVTAPTVAGIGIITAAGLKATAEMERAQVSFTTLLGTKDKADAFIQDIQEFAAYTPFSTTDMITHSKQLLAADMKTDEIEPFMRTWGDTAGALGLSAEEFNRAMYGVNQMMTSGRVNAQDALQLKNAGIPFWKLLSDATGKSVATLRDESKKGEISSYEAFPVLMKELDKQFGGSMAAQSQTLSGKWETLKDLTEMALIKEFEKMAPMFKNLLDFLQKHIPELVRLLGPELKKIFEAAIPMVKSFVIALKNLFKDGGFSEGIVKALNMLKGFFDRFSDLSDDTRRKVGVALGYMAGFGPAVFLVGKAIAFVGAGIKMIGGVITRLGLKSLLEGRGLKDFDLGKTIGKLFGKGGIKEAFLNIAGIVKNVFKKGFWLAIGITAFDGLVSGFMRGREQGMTADKEYLASDKVSKWTKQMQGRTSPLNRALQAAGALMNLLGDLLDSLMSIFDVAPSFSKVGELAGKASLDFGTQLSIFIMSLTMFTNNIRIKALEFQNLMLTMHNWLDSLNPMNGDSSAERNARMHANAVNITAINDENAELEEAALYAATDDSLKVKMDKLKKEAERKAAARRKKQRERDERESKSKKGEEDEDKPHNWKKTFDRMNPGDDKPAPTSSGSTETAADRRRDARKAERARLEQKVSTAVNKAAIDKLADLENKRNLSAAERQRRVERAMERAAKRALKAEDLEKSSDKLAHKIVAGQRGQSSAFSRAARDAIKMGAATSAQERARAEARKKAAGKKCPERPLWQVGGGRRDGIYIEKAEFRSNSPHEMRRGLRQEAARVSRSGRGGY